MTLSVPHESIGTAFAIKNILSGVILFVGPLYGGHLKNVFGAEVCSPWPGTELLPVLVSARHHTRSSMQNSSLTRTQ